MTSKREALEVEIYIMNTEYWLLFVVRGQETEKVYYMTTYKIGNDKEVKECADRFYKFYNYENGFDVGKPKNEQEYFDMDESGKYEGMSDYMKTICAPFFSHKDKETGKVNLTEAFKYYFQNSIRRRKVTLWVDHQCIGLGTELEEALADEVFNKSGKERLINEGKPKRTALS